MLPAEPIMQLPSAHAAANAASLSGQNSHLRFHIAQMVCLVLVPIVGIAAPDDPDYKVAQAIVSGGLFLGALLISNHLRAHRFDRQWYQGRALAESIKTMSWKYALSAEPYHGDSGAETFLSDLRRILKQARDLSLENVPDAGELTAGMERIRVLNWQERLSVYLHERIDSQRVWYREKSVYNRARERLWFRLLLGVQVLAMLACLVRVAIPAFPSAAVSIVATGSSSILAWMALKRHGELAQAYTQTSLDLSAVQALSGGVRSEADLVGYVSDAENAISREHSAWLSRREVA